MGRKNNNFSRGWGQSLENSESKPKRVWNSMSTNNDEQLGGLTHEDGSKMLKTMGMFREGLSKHKVQVSSVADRVQKLECMVGVLVNHARLTDQELRLISSNTGQK